jgi:hypothetical protein
MDSNLENILSEMKRLMDYDRSLGGLILEQGSADITDMNRAEQQLSDSPTRAVDKEGVWYKQKFKQYKGYFDNNMMLGECFDIKLFTSENANAYSAMNIPKDEIFKDNDGYYIKADTSDYGDKRKVKVYLPKNEFFNQFVGTVKSFIAYQTCNDFKKRQGGRKYSLMYQLTNPKNAIVTQVIDADGVKQIDDDPSRGWQITTFGGSQSGYFRNLVEGETIGDVPGSLMNSVLPSEFMEYSLQNYGEEYSRSEFDVWYDGKWGMATAIGVAILVSIATAGIGTAIAASIEAGSVLTRAIILGAEISGELLVNIPEAIYLQKRGQNGAATMILLLSLLPLFNKMNVIKRLSGVSLDTTQINNLIGQIDVKGLKTPGEIKAWLKTLDEGTRTYLEQTLQQGSKALAELDRKLLEKDIVNGLKKVVGEIKSSKVVTTTTKTATEELFKDIPTSKIGSTLKLIGLDLGAVFVSMPIIKTLIKDDEYLKKDPQKILEKASENTQKILDNLDKNKTDELRTKLIELESKITSNPDDKASAKEYVNILKDLSYIDGIKNYEEAMSEIMKQFLIDVENDLKIEYSLFLKDNNTNHIDKINKSLVTIPVISDSLFSDIISYCSVIPETQFKSKDDVCNFKDWVNKTHTEFTYPYEGGTGSGCKSCALIEKMEAPEWFLFKSCDLKYAYQKYKVEYSKFIK